MPKRLAIQKASVLLCQSRSSRAAGVPSSELANRDAPTIAVATIQWPLPHARYSSGYYLAHLVEVAIP